MDNIRYRELVSTDMVMLFIYLFLINKYVKYIILFFGDLIDVSTSGDYNYKLVVRVCYTGVKPAITIPDLVVRTHQQLSNYWT